MESRQGPLSGKQSRHGLQPCSSECISSAGQRLIANPLGVNRANPQTTLGKYATSASVCLRAAINFTVRTAPSALFCSPRSACHSPGSPACRVARPRATPFGRGAIDEGVDEYRRGVYARQVERIEGGVLVNPRLGQGRVAASHFIVSSLPKRTGMWQGRAHPNRPRCDLRSRIPAGGGESRAARRRGGDGRARPIRA